MSDIFLYYFPQLCPFKLFPLEISLQDIFSQITYNLLKSKILGL